jgi:hypothetical protein
VAAALAILSTPVRAQGYREVAGGWGALETSHGPSGVRFGSGPYLRGSLGSEIASRLGLRVDADALLFRMRTPLSLPCADTGCSTTLYTSQSRGIAAINANVVIAVLPHDVVYVTGGLGADEVFAQSNSVHVGGTAGFGVSIPVAQHGKLFGEVAWHAIHGVSDGPSHLVPVGLGYRFER